MARAINTTINTNNIVRTENFDRLTADIRRTPVLTEMEEETLFAQYRAADTESERTAIEQEIVAANLRFVLSVAKKYTSDAGLVSDLVSIGAIGLSKAVKSFDETCGFKFISYAVHKIRAEFAEYFRSDGALVRRSNNSVIGNKDIKVAERLYSELMREPSEEEIIDALRNEYGLEVKNRLDIVRLHTDYLSAKTDEDGATLEEVGEVAVRTACTNTYESEIETEDRQYKVARLLSVLPIAQRDIVSRAFGIGYDRAYEDAEIAEELGYTAERVRQIKNAAVARMKKSAVAAAMAM